MVLVYERRGGFSGRSIALPDGDRGTGVTLEVMQRLAIEGSKDLEVRAAAIEALDRSGARPHHIGDALCAVFRFVRDRIRFVGDPVGVQGIQSPRLTLQLRAGNCAQRATLVAAMLRSIGVPAALRFRVIAANRNQPGKFSHVYVVANVGGKDIPMDPTYRENAIGYEYPNAFRKGDMPL